MLTPPPAAAAPEWMLMVPVTLALQTHTAARCAAAGPFWFAQPWRAPSRLLASHPPAKQQPRAAALRLVDGCSLRACDTNGMAGSIRVVA